MFDQLNPVHYIPIATTLLSLFFFFKLQQHYFKGGRKQHIAWWCVGIFTYGMGTFLEASITLSGNTVMLNKLWYIFGALLGGYPLAQGSVYLHMTKRKADILTIITLPVIIIASILVFVSPVNLDAMQSFKPSGRILGWQWVRLISPFINTYSAIFLIGGAAYSSYRFFKTKTNKYRAIGNVFIATGALLPGIGGAMAKGGVVEALYIGEFIGIIFIWIGYKICLINKTTTA